MWPTCTCFYPQLRHPFSPDSVYFCFCVPLAVLFNYAYYSASPCHHCSFSSSCHFHIPSNPAIVHHTTLWPLPIAAVSVSVVTYWRDECLWLDLLRLVNGSRQHFRRTRAAEGRGGGEKGSKGVMRIGSSSSAVTKHFRSQGLWCKWGGNGIVKWPTASIWPT